MVFRRYKAKSGVRHKLASLVEVCGTEMNRFVWGKKRDVRLQILIRLNPDTLGISLFGWA